MIRVSNVTKRYGETLAVNSVSFEVTAGEIVGFLGPNGAGKSTLLKMLSTYIAPTSGTLEIAGHDTQREVSCGTSLGRLSRRAQRALREYARRPIPAFRSPCARIERFSARDAHDLGRRALPTR